MQQRPFVDDDEDLGGIPIPTEPVIRDDGEDLGGVPLTTPTTVDEDFGGVPITKADDSRDIGFFEGMAPLASPSKMASSFMSGYESAEKRANLGKFALGLGLAEAVQRASDEAERWEKNALTDDDVARMGTAAKALHGAFTSILPGMAHALVSPEAMTTAAVGGGVGAAAGAAGMGVGAIPVGIAGAATGYGYGVTGDFYLQSVGDILETGMQNGIDFEDMRALAIVAGVPYAALERLKLGAVAKPILKPVARQLAKKGVAGAATTVLGRAASNVATEVGTEAAQQGLSLSTAAFAALDNGDKEKFIEMAEKVGPGMMEEAKNAVGPMGVLAITGMSVDGAGAAAELRLRGAEAAANRDFKAWLTDPDKKPLFTQRLKTMLNAEITPEGEGQFRVTLQGKGKDGTNRTFLIRQQENLKALDPKSKRRFIESLLSSNEVRNKPDHVKTFDALLRADAEGDAAALDQAVEYADTNGYIPNGMTHTFKDEATGVERPVDALITLGREADRETLDHELFHAILPFFFTRKEYESVIRQFGGNITRPETIVPAEEAAAYAYQSVAGRRMAVETQLTAPERMLYRLATRIKSFTSGVMGKKADALYDRIYSGETVSAGTQTTAEEQQARIAPVAAESVQTPVDTPEAGIASPAPPSAEDGGVPLPTEMDQEGRQFVESLYQNRPATNITWDSLVQQGEIAPEDAAERAARGEDPERYALDLAAFREEAAAPAAEPGRPDAAQGAPTEVPGTVAEGAGAPVAEPSKIPGELEPTATDTSSGEGRRYMVVGRNGVMRMAQQDRDRATIGWNVAKQMTERGEDSEKIRVASGWWKAKDGKWRYEISDKTSEVSGRVKKLTGTDEGLLKDFLIHPDLFRSYPELRDVEVSVTKGPDAVKRGALYTPEDGSPIMEVSGRTDEEVRMVLLHEAQHYVQRQEMFARGGSRDEMRPEATSESDAYRRYRQLHGEMEARDTVYRRDMTPAQRKRTPPMAKVNEIEPDAVPGAAEVRYSTAPLSREPRGQKYTPTTLTDADAKSNLSKMTRHFGLTADTREAGYVLPDGRMLDLSGKRQGGERGVRYRDHRELPDLGGEDRNANMLAAKNSGAARVDFSAGMVNISVPMTPKQVETIVRGMEAAGPEFMYIELDDPATHNSVYYADMEGGNIPALRRSINEANAVARGERGGESVRYSAAAYHGSPHRDIEKTGFSTDKIGTGEGAQAYGWGLYFADKEEVAEHYRRELANGGKISEVYVDGVPYKENENLSKEYLDALDFVNYSNDLNEAIQNLRAQSSQAWRGNEAKKLWAKRADIIESIKDRISLKERTNKGQLYEVELAPDDDEYLLWDKPLSEQSEKVKKALEGAVKSGRINPDGLDIGGATIRDNRKRQADPSQAYPWILDSGTKMFGLTQQDVDRMLSEQNDATGNNLYTRLSAQEGGQQAASTFLHSLGIRGIKYLDGDSRSKGEGAYNYVIFNDKDVKVTGTRYSTARRDKEYMDAVERGDMETAQRMVDEAAKRAGYSVGPVWHGTNASFTVFDTDEESAGRGPEKPWSADYINGTIFLSNKRDTAEYYGKNVMRFYLKKKGLKKFRVAGHVARAMDDDFAFEVVNHPVIEVTNGEESIYATLSSSAVKSADPVTRDDKGNVIPLSKRFDTSSPDIRYSTTSKSPFNNETMPDQRNAVGFPELVQMVREFLGRNPKIKQMKPSVAGAMRRDMINRRADILLNDTVAVGPVVFTTLAPDAKPDMLDKIRVDQAEQLGMDPDLLVLRTRPLKKGVLVLGMVRDPEYKARVLAHQIGHLADWMFGDPAGTFDDKANDRYDRGNILGRIAGLRKYMMDTLGADPSRQGDAITPEEYEEIRQLMSEPAPAGWEWVTELVPDGSGITAEDIVSLFTSTDARDRAPELYKAFTALSDADRKRIAKAAMKGVVDPALAGVGGRMREERVRREVPARPKSKAQIMADIKAEVERLVKLRGLYRRDAITQELKALSQWWSPFNESEDAAYTRYRHSPHELYADAVSVLLNQPEALAERAPEFWSAMQGWKENKPEFWKEYTEIQDAITGGRVEGDRIDREMAMMRAAEAKHTEIAKEKKDSGRKWTWDEIAKSIAHGLWNRASYLPKAAQQHYKDIVYSSGRLRAYGRSVHLRVLDPLRDAGVTMPEFGVYLGRLRASTERRDFFNPFDPDVPALRARFGNKKFDAMQAAQRELVAVRKEFVLSHVREAGLLPEHLMQYIEGNDAYAKFTPIEFLGDKIGIPQGMFRLFRQHGTLANTDNPLYATVEQDMLMMYCATLNKGKRDTIATLEQVAPGSVRRPTTALRGRKVVKVPPKEKNLGRIVYVVDGVQQEVYVDERIAELFQREPIKASLPFRILQAITIPQKGVLTTYNPLFGIWNFKRDFARFGRNAQFGVVQRMIHYGRTAQAAANYVFRDGLPEEAREMLVNGLLIAGRTWSAMERDSVEEHIERQVESWGDNPSRRTNFLMRAGKLVFNDWNQYLEVWTKFAAFDAMKKRGLTPGSVEMKEAIREQLGSPDFLAGGTATRVLNSVFIFSNANVQGITGDWGSFKKDPAWWLMHMAAYTILPAVMMSALEQGWFVDEDDDDGFFAYVQDLYRRIPEYDKCRTLPIPFRRNGPRAGYMPIPVDQTGALAHQTVRSLLAGSRIDKVGTVRRMVVGTIPWSQSNLNGVLDVAMDVMAVASGINPPDFFRGVDKIDPTVFEAGGADVYKEIAKNTWNDTFGGVSVRFDRRWNIEDKDSKLQVPKMLVGPLGRFYRESDLGLQDETRLTETEIGQEGASQRKAVKDWVYERVNDGMKEPTGKAQWTRLYKDAVKNGDIPKGYSEQGFRALVRAATERAAGRAPTKVSPVEYADTVVGPGFKEPVNTAQWTRLYKQAQKAGGIADGYSMADFKILIKGALRKRR